MQKKSMLKVVWHATSAALLVLSVWTPILAVAAFERVRVPIETFYRKPNAQTHLSAKLWVASKKTVQTEIRRAVLLAPFSAEMSSLIPELQQAGFSILAIELRGNGAQGPKTLVEDIQSGVVFLKTDARVHANKIAIIGTHVGANGATHYAGATKQMAHIVDALVLLSPDKQYQKTPFSEPLKNVLGIPITLFARQDDKDSTSLIQEAQKQCQTQCKAVVYPKGTQGITTLKETLISFLLRPHG